VAADAADALVRALKEAVAGSIGVLGRHEGGPGLTVSIPGHTPITIEVRGVAARAEPGQIAHALPAWEAQLEALRHNAAGHVVGVVVASAIPHTAKEILRDNGWGWLDRRGELHLRAPGLMVHTTDIAPSTAHLATSARDPIRGRAGITTAACLLLDADRAPGVREIARRGDLAPSTVSTALSDLRAASLLEEDGRPLVPELFWALADAWKPDRHAFADLPSSRLSRRVDSLDDPGWGVCGTLAAAAWHAPVIVAADAPPDFYVPTERDLRAAQRELRAAHTLDERACTITVAPTVLAIRPRYESSLVEKQLLGWPIVHPLFVALDLALDRSRGVEILGDWQPPAPFARVW
jgi:hypothetical protein